MSWIAQVIIVCQVVASPLTAQTAQTGDPAAAALEEAALEEAALEEAALEEAKKTSRFDDWLEQVRPLITGAERELFKSLKKDYQREAFIHQFWKVRDPYPRTVRNELKERWPERVAQAKANYTSLKDARSHILLVHGPPSAGFSVRCTTTRRPAEVWAYGEGSDFIDFPFYLIFIRPSDREDAKLWVPGATGSLELMVGRIRGCTNGDRLVRVLDQTRADSNYAAIVQRAAAKPRPSSEEWIYTFVAHSTDMPTGAAPLSGKLEIAYPGRHQLRTVLQAYLTVSAEQAAIAEFAGYRSYEFQLTGEVIRGDSLFESFRYKFGFPAEVAPAEIPLAFQRYLRPGEYRLVLRLDDLNSNRVYRSEQKIEVPESAAWMETLKIEDSVSAQLFSEASAAIEAGETVIRIVPPRGTLQTGFVRFSALVIGDEIKKVRFLLDEGHVLTKNRPPYNVEIDLGDYPDLHTLRVEGLDAEGRELASDEHLINAGGHRFIVKLVEPRRGKSYGKSVRARAEVEVPEGRSLDRVELYLGEILMATLYQEPFVHPIILPESEELSYVRAVAYLPDGNSTEDMVFVNTPENFEELDVQFVELYTTVLDGQGRPVEGLGRDRFKVLEDGRQQEIRRFEQVEDQPIHVGVLIDNSASMVGTLGEVRKAALSFFQQAITPKDRAAVVTFNSFPHLAVELTNDTSRLGSGLAGLVPEGQTALYDSVMFSLYYFTGIKGQRAILVLSDGKDESSRFSFDETLDYARRAGITIYTIGFRLGDGGARSRLSRLADETGGRSFFIKQIEELEDVYTLVQRELRSQYLIAYQSSNQADDGKFRSVDLKVDRADVTVKTLSGYYP